MQDNLPTPVALAGADIRLFQTRDERQQAITAEQERNSRGFRAAIGWRDCTPRPGAPWRIERLFIDSAELEEEVGHDVAGRASLIREWFCALGLATAEDQAAFLAVQRRLHADAEGAARG